MARSTSRETQRSSSTFTLRGHQPESERTRAHSTRRSFDTILRPPAQLWLAFHLHARVPNWEHRQPVPGFQEVACRTAPYTVKSIGKKKGLLQAILWAGSESGKGGVSTPCGCRRKRHRGAVAWVQGVHSGRWIVFPAVTRKN